MAWYKEKQQKCLSFWFTSWKQLKFQTSVCADILVTHLQFGFVVWTKSKVLEHFVVFPVPHCVNGNQHGGHEYDDLQN